MRPEQVKPGVKVRHYKGHEYTVIALARMESVYNEYWPSESVCVVYGDGTENWIRRLYYGNSPFCGEVSTGVERFTVVEEQP